MSWMSSQKRADPKLAPVWRASVDDHVIKSAHDVFDALSGHKAGDTVTVTYLRDGESQQVQVRLQAAG